MARLAWLNADIENDVGRRVDLFPKDHPLLEMPKVKLAPYLLEYCLEVGLFKHGAMGTIPIEWADIAAWVSLTGTEVTPDEVRCIRDMSFVYLSQINKAQKQDCPAPFLESEQIQQKRKSTDQAVRQSLARFK